MKKYTKKNLTEAFQAGKAFGNFIDESEWINQYEKDVESLSVPVCAFSESSWKDELKKVNNCSQRQDSLKDQLSDLRIIANRFGFYDAADFLKNIYSPK